RGNFFLRRDAQTLEQGLAVGTVPIRVKPPHKLNGAVHLAPGLEIKVWAHIANLLLHSHGIALMILSQNRDPVGVTSSHPEQEIHGRGFTSTVGADEAVDRAARNRHIDRTELELREEFFQTAYLDCTHGFSAFSLMIFRKISEISRGSNPASIA